MIGRCFSPCGYHWFTLLRSFQSLCAQCTLLFVCIVLQWPFAFDRFLLAPIIRYLQAAAMLSLWDEQLWLPGNTTWEDLAYVSLLLFFPKPIAYATLVWNNTQTTFRSPAYPQRNDFLFTLAIGFLMLVRRLFMLYYGKSWLMHHDVVCVRGCPPFSDRIAWGIGKRLEGSEKWIGRGRGGEGM